jgi:putative endonuclease
MLNSFQHPTDYDIQSAAMERQPCVYILASGPRGTLYIGVTSNLLGRLTQHREATLPGFTARYRLKRLVFFEMADTMDAAISREKRLKRWHRDWKLNLIEQYNPHWEDLAIGLGFARL